MKTWMRGSLSLALTMAVALTSIGMPGLAEAKRLGSGKSQGMQREMPARTAPDAPAGKPAQTPPAASPAAPATAGAAAAAAPAKRSWMGPLAGLAAGLGLAALFSHFGMGEGLANFVMLALVVVAGFLLVRFLMARFGAGANRGPAFAGAQAGSNGNLNTPLRASEPPMQREMVDERPAAYRPAPEPLPATAPTSLPVQAADTPAPRVTAAFVPASFDSEGFSRIAKMIFIRMQTANDAADLDDLRRFTTPEMFASIRLEIQERGGAAQVTDVQHVDAEVLDVAQDAERQIVSVRFRGRVLEDKGSQPTNFDEVWHLVKPAAAVDDNAAWAIAGIEQMA
jgi:predicted lipid-binding transport protein (Tim44 family)